MGQRFFVFVMVLFLGLGASVSGQEVRWWDQEVEHALKQSGSNRPELEKALHQAPRPQRPGIAFLIANMPAKDLTALKADFLLKNLDLAYQARAKMPWSKDVPQALFLNDVLPYASVTETREAWRQAMMARCLPMVKDCKSITEAAQALNAGLFAKVQVRYSTKRHRPDQSPGESIKIGMASCTGLSILLVDACRSVGIPARVVGIPKWAHKPGNHTWVEIWDGAWRFTGACEHDKNGLNRAWFAGEAKLAKKDSIESAIYAASFKRTTTRFPLPWAPRTTEVFAENVTDRYTGATQKPDRVPTGKSLSNEQRTRVFEAARDFFDNNKKLDTNLDEVLRLNEDAVRQAVWQAYAGSKRHADLKADFAKKQVKTENRLSPYSVKHVGKRPKAGWPLFIAMHGGGGVPKKFNDSQWNVMKIYYRDQPSVEGYTYVALRAPNDVWNGFYDDPMCPLIINLIRQFTLFGDVDPNKVFIMGYSHGGYGAFFIGPKIPDRFAAIHASAAAQTPGTISAKSLRNTRFTFMIGENDNAYGRRAGCQQFAKLIEELRKANPGDYPVEMEFKKGLGHGGLPDRDKIKEMYRFERNAVPRRLTWEPTDPFLKDFFWLTVAKPARGQTIDVKVAGNDIRIAAEKVEQLSLWLDHRLVKTNRPLKLTVNGTTTSHKLTPALATLCESLVRRGDIHLAASCRVDVNPEPGKK
ncbi:MAG: hypothetical protein HYX68_14265 [Planctomycetes bacterium]|jgi:predicted esterase|nr:hypothetical protein [Planctomycetota bacterium]